MKATWDPSMLLWGEERLANHAYLELAVAAVWHLKKLEEIPVNLVMPSGWHNIFQYFPFGDERFHPEAMELSSLFWGFMGNNPHRWDEVTALDEVVALQPEICPTCLPNPEKLLVKGFFGQIAEWKEQGVEEVVVLTSSAEPFKPVGGVLNVLMVARDSVITLDVGCDNVGWERVEEQLDHRPNVIKCVQMRSRRLSKDVMGTALRPFTLTQSLAEHLAKLSIEDAELFWEIVDTMARWAAGITAGLKVHKLNRNKWRLDVRKGDGNKVHCRFRGDQIEFFEYHDDHDQYKIN